MSIETLYGVAADYEWTGERDRLTVWSGAFMGTFEAEGLSLPNGDGYMLTTYNDGDTVRVSCPAPRDDRNFREVDDAINAALNEYERKRGSIKLK